MSEESKERIEDRQAISACQNGDRDAFESIVLRYAARATGIARSILRDHGLAEDAAQEAFVRAYRAIHRFRLEEPFYPWLYRIVKNVCLSKLKKKRLAVWSIDHEDAPTLEGPEFDVAAKMKRDELRNSIHQAMDTLSEPHREIIHLSHFEELPYKEIAACLDIPVGTVMSRLWAARKKLKTALAPLVSTDE